MSLRKSALEYECIESAQNDGVIFAMCGCSVRASPYDKMKDMLVIPSTDPDRSVVVSVV